MSPALARLLRCGQLARDHHGVRVQQRDQRDRGQHLERAGRPELAVRILGGQHLAGVGVRDHPRRSRDVRQRPRVLARAGPPRSRALAISGPPIMRAASLPSPGTALAPAVPPVGPVGLAACAVAGGTVALVGGTPAGLAALPWMLAWRWTAQQSGRRAWPGPRRRRLPRQVGSVASSCCPDLRCELLGSGRDSC